MKTPFDLSAFLIENRLTIPDLAAAMNVHVDTVYKIQRRRTVKMSFLKSLEKQFGDCSKYIKTTEKVAESV